MQILGEHVVVSGGIADTLPIAYSNGKTKSSMIVGLAIGGNVEASNVVCDEGYFLPERANIIPLLQELESKHTPSLRRPTACLATPCVMIRDGLFGDMKTSEFRKAFPKMRIFGFRCFGEIGTKPCKSRGDDDNAQSAVHYYSVVLSILKFL